MRALRAAPTGTGTTTHRLACADNRLSEPAAARDDRSVFEFDQLAETRDLEHRAGLRPGGAHDHRPTLGRQALVCLSQRHHVKLRELAQEIVDAAARRRPG